MPSSPTFNDYKRGPNQRFFYRGISLVAADALAEGKVSRAQNVRSRVEGEITVRDGLRRITSGALNGAANSVFRLNDPALLAGGVSALQFFGTETGRLYAAAPDAGAAAAYAEIDSGYSGEPLSGIPAMPVNSPQPWLYVSDSVQMRKYNAASQVRSIGLPPPANPPVALIADSQTTFLQSIDSGSWVAYGGAAGAVSASASARLNAVVNAIIYDEGAVGMASVALDNMDGVTEGATIQVGVGGETVIVQEVIPAISPTTIQAILYDQGNNGYCTIQPTGSFALGQTEAALPAELRERYHPATDADPPPPRVTITRPVDFPVNALVMINGIELVRIVSIAVGTDGVMSMRAFTAGTYGPGQSLTGAACFRAFFLTTRAGGDPATAPAAENAITPPDASTTVVGGIQTAVVPERDWSQVGNRAMQPEDLIMFSVNVDQLAYVEFVRLLLATNTGSVPAGEEFSRNYYQYEWRANDLIQAIQRSGVSADAAGVQTMLEAQTAAVASGQVESFYQADYGTEPLVMGGNVNGNGPVVAPGPAAPRTDGFVTAGTAPSRQLALGNRQWITLQCRVGDLLRVGTDAGRTLQNLNGAAIVLQVSGTASAVTVQYSDVILTGGYGPDCGQTSPPYVWRYRYRSTITGERSNPSPSMRGGIPARRQRVELRAEGCTEAQCDVIDWFRYGGTLARWAYVRSAPNDTGGGVVTCHDDMADRQIDGGETLRVDLFQPFPTSDLPRSGTCRVVGTSVERISGDVFDPSWAPDTLILVNGRATSLYGSPTSGQRLTVIDNCDAGDPVEWSIPAPTLMAQPLQCTWGGFVGNVWFHFGVGDPTDPGALHWTHGNDPDSSSDANTLAITPSTEPLQNGVVWDQTAFVFSTEGLFRLDPAFGSLATFQPVRTSCSRGLWNKWALCVGDEGMYFVAQDGIFVTAGGEEVSIVDPDIRALFPRDGSNPDPCGPHCLDAIDMLGPMKLTRVDQMIYFDYRSACDGKYRTLVYEPLYKRWTPDLYIDGTAGARSRMEEPGALVHTNVIGCQDGHGRQFEGTEMADDETAGIDWFVSTPWANGQDPRALKQWGDTVVEADSGQSCDGILVEPVVDNGTVGLATTVIGALIAGRQTYMVENPAGGVLSRNFGLLVSGVVQALDVDRPILYFWEPSWLWKQTPIARRVTDWEDLGYKGAKFVQGVVIRANTFNQLKTLAVEYDGGTQALQLALHHNGELQVAYPRDDAGWTPFAAELVRLRGLDDVEWTLNDWRWIWEPAPELASQWETQDTTFDFPGYGSVADAVLAYQSPVATTLTIWHGTSVAHYAIPSSGNIYRRHFIKFRAAKGLSYRFRWTGDQPFRVFHRDTSMRVQPWGDGGYRTVAPFGGPSRVAGAEV